MGAPSASSTAPADARDASAIVSRQLARVVRRGNGFVLQRVLYEVVALGAAIAVALVGLAFVLAATTYALVTWAAVAVWLWFVVRAVRRGRTAWLGDEATIALDRRAALENRLSTLLGLADRAPDSRLWPLLVRQNLDALPRWTPERITPRAVPRSLFAALAAVGALAGTLWLLPGGASDGGFLPRPEPAARPEEPTLAELPPGSDAEPSAAEGPLVDWSDYLASLPERIRDEILRRARRAPPATSPPEGARPVGKSPSQGAAAGGGPAEGIGDDARPQKGAGEGAGDRPSDIPMKLAERDRPRVDEGAPPPAPPKQGDGLKMLGANPNLPGLGASPSAGGPGAGTGTDGEGLFGAAEEAGGGPSGVFSFDLDAERGRGGEGEDEGDGTRSEAALASEHRLDDAVRRARVPPAYEKIVERLFQRQPGERAR